MFSIFSFTQNLNRSLSYLYSAHSTHHRDGARRSKSISHDSSCQRPYQHAYGGDSHGRNDLGRRHSSQSIHHSVSYQASAHAPNQGHSTQKMAYHHSSSYEAGVSAGRLEHSSDSGHR